MRILVCGDRNWHNREIIRNELIKFLPDASNTIIIHGAARGADTIAGLIGAGLGMKVLAFPAEWHKYGRAAGPIRNQRLLDEGKPEMVLAFHNNIHESKGTKDMVSRARKAGLKVVIINDKYPGVNGCCK